MNNEETKYKVVNGVYYHIDTNDEVITTLEIARSSLLRIFLDYGDIETGESWGETNDLTGYIGTSTGKIKIPLLIYNKRSSGGHAILTNRIIGIYTSLGKKQLYKLKK